jgi:hypothetical protein
VTLTLPVVVLMIGVVACLAMTRNRPVRPAGAPTSAPTELVTEPA